MLPDSLVTPLQEHLQLVKWLHEEDLAKGYGSVYLPFALERKYPNADREWIWQYIFPSNRLSKDPRSGVVRHHHISESSLQKAVRKAARLAGINKRVTCHTFRHSFATHLLENGYDTPGPLALSPVPFVPGPKDQGPVGPGQVRPKPLVLWPKDRGYRAQGQRVRTVQELLGHKDVRTTMIYTPVLSGVEGHVLNRGALAVRSPLD